MLHAYACHGGKLTQVVEPESDDHLRDAVWFDIESPTPEEIADLTRLTGLSIPAEADLAEIESSSRLSSEAAPTGAVLTLSMPLVYRPAEGGHSAPLGIVLAPERLITVRFAPSLVFQNFASQPHEPAEPRSADILVGLFEALVDRQADALEQMRSEIDRMSHHIFHLKLDAAGKLEGARRRQQENDLRAMVTTLGRLYDSISLIRDSQLGIARIVPYIGTSAAWVPKSMAARLKTVGQDVSSLNEFITHLTDKVQFMLDAVLGLINISQNDLMKVLTIVSVIGIPPTLVAGIYGMNFVNIPELHWSFGYWYGLAVIAVTGVAPLFWFRRKGWL
ncbi:magnesium transporter CorA family protein [Acidocella sp.]|uniref:magnesium transporter CorA family protein n=1 Tax=Acidocella sp. TaxID=50710 RepID=UPI002F409E7D